MNSILTKHIEEMKEKARVRASQLGKKVGVVIRGISTTEGPAFVFVGWDASGELSSAILQIDRDADCLRSVDSASWKDYTEALSPRWKLGLLKSVVQLVIDKGQPA